MKDLSYGKRLIAAVCIMVSGTLGRGAGALILSSRGIQTSAVAAAVPALTDQVRSGGFLSKLFGSGSSRVTTPLSEPLAGVSLPEYNAPASRPTTDVTVLPSGMKIASENTPVRIKFSISRH